MIQKFLEVPRDYVSSPLFAQLMRESFGLHSVEDVVRRSAAESMTFTVIYG